MGSAVDLVVVVVQTSDVGTGELGNLTGRATNTASNVENLHSLLDTHGVGEVVLMASNGLVEGLTVGETAEVEGLTPTVLVQVGSQVVVVAGQGSVLGSSGLFRGSV